MAKFYGDMLLKYYFLLNKNLLKRLRLFESEFSGLLWQKSLVQYFQFILGGFLRVWFIWHFMLESWPFLIISKLLFQKRIHRLVDNLWIHFWKENKYKHF